MTQAKTPQIIQQQLALDVYLQNLLEAVPEAVELEVEPKISLKLAESVVVVPVVVEPQPVIEPQPQPPKPSKPIKSFKVQQPELVQAENKAKLQPLSVMPDWALHDFQALFFKVEDLILATPLTELSRTLKVERKPGMIPGQPSWFMGLLDEHDSRIGILDTGQLIFGKQRASQRDLVARPFKHILVTQDKRWGLACDEILSIGRLSPEKVRWRTGRQKKAWLIGTVIEDLTAIVDLRQLVPHRRIDN